MKYERKDARYRQAKAEGYRARSAYKLVELDDRYRLLHQGDRVVDLGAWPGGWLQVAVERIGPAGCVVGVDLVPIEPLPRANVHLVVGDIGDSSVIANALEKLAGKADVVLSDVAPKLTGVRDTDDARCENASRAVIVALRTLLKPGGGALLKVFMNRDYRATLDELRGAFRAVKTTRPEATRRASAELYVVAEGFVPVTHTCG